MHLTFTLADLANLATVVIGASALGLSVLTSRQAGAQQRRTVELENLNQLRPLLRDIAELIPRIYTDTSMKAWGAEGEKLRTLAEHAQRLMSEVAPEAVSATDMTLLARAFFTVWRNEDGQAYLDRAVRVMEAQANPTSAVPFMNVLQVKAETEFMFGLLDAGRASFERALQVSTGTQVDIEMDVFTLLRWAFQEHTQTAISHRDECVGRAETLAATLTQPFRRMRSQASVVQAREWYRTADQGFDVATLRTESAVYWAGWYAAQGNAELSQACLRRAEEQAPGISGVLGLAASPLPPAPGPAPDARADTDTDTPQDLAARTLTLPPDQGADATH